MWKHSFDFATMADLSSKLPCLPGHTFQFKSGDTKHHKAHAFDFSNGVPGFDETKPGIGGSRLQEQKQTPGDSSRLYPNNAQDGESVPAWVAFDRQVLRFDAYFREAVHEKRDENYRIRKCTIFFYLEDDSIQVTEHRVKNSGIPQGTLIRRHRIPKPNHGQPTETEEFYTSEDFNVGVTIDLYSRMFVITDCDDFTNHFLSKLGVQVNGSISMPSDPYTMERNKMLAAMKPRRPYVKEDTLKQFLNNDRKVLRFSCLWDDTEAFFGDRRKMILHYFLADDTIEIREEIPINSGRDTVSHFLRRQRLSKMGGTFGPGERPEDYYTDQDLVIGGHIFVYGRPFVLVSCDEFTKEYYRSKYGLSEFNSGYKETHETPRVEREIPPYNGFGSEDDSLGSCISLIPKPPRKDFKKLMSKDNMVLRFFGRLDTSKSIDAGRSFIIYYYLADDTILVFEPHQRNSGIVGGKFLERMRIKRPDCDEYYGPNDFFVGNKVTFMNHKFILKEADEYAYAYMEQNKEEFPKANPASIQAKINSNEGFAGKVQEALSTLVEKYGPTCTPKEFREHLVAASLPFLTVHEIITLSRYALDAKENVQTNSLRSFVR